MKYIETLYFKENVFENLLIFKESLLLIADKRQTRAPDFTLELSITHPRMFSFEIILESIQKASFCPVEKLFVLLNSLNEYKEELIEDANTSWDKEKWTSFFTTVFGLYREANEFSSTKVKTINDSMNIFLYSCALNNYTTIEEIIKKINPRFIIELNIYEQLFRNYISKALTAIKKIYRCLIKFDFECNQSINYTQVNTIKALHSLVAIENYEKMQTLCDDFVENFKNDLKEIKSLVHVIKICKYNENKYPTEDKIAQCLEYAMKLNNRELVTLFSCDLFFFHITNYYNLCAAILIKKLLEFIPRDYSAPPNIIGIKTTTCIDFHAKALLLAIDLREKILFTKINSSFSSSGETHAFFRSTKQKNWKIYTNSRLKSTKT